MALPDLAEFEAFANERLRVKIGGKEYVLPPVGIADGLLVQRAAAGDAAAQAEWDAGDRSYRIFLGATYDQMVADNVPLEAVDRAHLTAVALFQHGPVAAAKVWEVGHDPEELASIMEAVRMLMILRDKAGDAASSTPRRGSGSSTTSRKTTRSEPRKGKAGNSPGSKSVPTGD